MIVGLAPGANPTTVRYNARVVKNTTPQVAKCISKNRNSFFILKNTLQSTTTLAL
jgi:hypothetical protein